MKVIAPLILLALGFYAGWYFRGHSIDRETVAENLSPDPIVQPRVVQDKPAEFSNVFPKENSSSVPNLEGDNKRIARLLDEGRFSEALEHYQKIFTEEQDPQLQRELQHKSRQDLIGYMQTLKAEGLDDLFIDLVDAYLAEYFDDVEVMLLLAEFNVQSEYYFEAVNVFQLANEYAYSPGSKKTVADAFEKAMSGISQSLLDQDNVSLSQQVYFHAVSTGLVPPQQQLAQAELYLKYGYDELAIDILGDLRGDALVRGRVQELLSQTTSLEEGVGAQDRYESSVALERLGNQYIVSLYVEGNPVRLLIDTGASVTTITRSAYERLFGASSATLIGTRMFRTANGMAKGDIVRFPNVSFAGYNLAASDIAVLDFDMSHGIDGLLGMNMLGKFRFNIEPESKQLLLTPLF